MQTKLPNGYVMISGTTGKDAEYRIVGEKNSSLTKFSVAVGERMNGDQKEAIWANVDCWHLVARACKGIKKGDKVFVIGLLKESEGTDRDGNKRIYKSIDAEYVGFIGDSNAVTAQTAPVASVGNLDGFETVSGDDNAPF